MAHKSAKASYKATPGHPGKGTVKGKAPMKKMQAGGTINKYTTGPTAAYIGTVKAGKRPTTGPTAAAIFQGQKAGSIRQQRKAAYAAKRRGG